MRTLRDEALRLVAEGDTTIAEVLRTVYVALGDEEPCRSTGTSPSTPTAPRSRATSKRRARPRVRRELLLQQPRGRSSVKQQRSLDEIEITPQKVPPQEIMHFSRQLAAFVRGGIPIIDGARGRSREGTSNKRFRQILARRCDEEIREGVPFADALAEHATIFPPYYLGILRSAELTGHLDVGSSSSPATSSATSKPRARSSRR